MGKCQIAADFCDSCCASLFCYVQGVNSVKLSKIVSNRRPYREYYVDALGEPSEKAWVAGKAIVLFEGRHQFEELPILRRRGKQKEKGYKHKVKDLLSLTRFWFLECARWKVVLCACRCTLTACFCGRDCSNGAREEVILCICLTSMVYKLLGVSGLPFMFMSGCAHCFCGPAELWEAEESGPRQYESCSSVALSWCQLQCAFKELPVLSGSLFWLIWSRAGVAYLSEITDWDKAGGGF